MHDLIGKDDDFLVRLYLSEKKTEALEVLFYRHKDSLLQSILYWGLPQDVAEDLVQDTYLRVIDSLNENKYKCENRFFGWMLRIAKNLMIDMKRRHKRGREIFQTSFEPSFFGYTSDSDPLPWIEDEYKSLQLDRALSHLDKLPYSQKEIIVLRIFHEMTFKDISAQLDISINTALGRMRYGLINLKKLWKESELTRLEDK